MQKSGVEIWVKSVLPSVGSERSAAVAFLNRRTDGTPTRVSVVLSDIGLSFNDGYEVLELFDGKELGFYKPDDKLTVMVNPSGKLLQIFQP